MNASAALVEALARTLAFAPAAERVGNLAWGRGALDGRPVRVAFIENRGASGAIGRAECERLVALFKVVARERSPLVLAIDSAGARVSEGLPAMAAFRNLFRAGLDAAMAGAPLAAVLGRHCFGAASMLAHLAPQRLMSNETQLAMSGPAILAAAAGTSATDEMFRAMAQASITPEARAKTSSANTVWSEGIDLAAWLREALAPRGDPAANGRLRHEGLATRIERRGTEPAWEPLRRRELERIYEGGYDTRESQGLVEGRGRRGTGDEAILGVVGSAPLGTQRAWRFADRAWQLSEAPPARLELLLDCATHAPRLEDERIVLSEFIVDMSVALATLAARGTRLGLTVLGRAGGGVYVALAAPAARVAAVYGADIQVLPGSAVAAILGESREAVPSFAEYRSSGVAEEEIKLGFVPRTA